MPWRCRAGSSTFSRRYWVGFNASQLSEATRRLVEIRAEKRRLVMKIGAQSIFDAHRKRVKDDAFELIVAIKILEPLLSGALHALGAADVEKIPIFLRRILTRYAILDITRLLAPIGAGKTGTTASLRSLLWLAAKANTLPAAFLLSTKTRIAKVEKEFEREGFEVRDLMHLRHTQIAHTLIAHQDSNQIWAHTLVEAADELFAIATDIEKALVEGGCEPLIDTSSAPAAWEAESLKFWNKLKQPAVLL